ncbi:MAG: hypothetical protein Q9167_005932 [Letrouitia subvulpina]
MRSLFSIVNLLLLPSLSFAQANPNPFCSSSEAWFAPGTTRLNTTDCVIALQLFFNETDTLTYLNRNITLLPASPSKPSVSPSPLSGTPTVSGAAGTLLPNEGPTASTVLPTATTSTFSTLTAEAKRYVHGSCVLAVNLRSSYRNSLEPDVIAVSEAKSLEEAQVQGSTSEGEAGGKSDIVVYDELAVKAQELLAACLSGQRGEAGYIVAGRNSGVVVLFAGVGGVIDRSF